MDIGIPKESRPSEYRVGFSPAGVQMLMNRGLTCYIGHNAGLHVGFSDQNYEKVEGQIVYSAHEVFGRAELVLKVTRPQEEELILIQPGAAIGGALHLPATSQTKIHYLLKNRITPIAYKQIQHEDGTRPVLQIISEIGGKLIAQIAAFFLQNNTGGKGILLGGIPGIPPVEEVTIGAGVLGDLYWKTIRQRAESLIKIAHPKFREELKKQSKQLHYI